MNGGAKIIVNSGGVLIVDGGTIQNANIEMKAGSQIVIKNAGTVNTLSNIGLTVPVGANAAILYGTVN